MAQGSSPPPTSAFVSYAHADKHWVDELKNFLTPWVREHRIRVWDDRQIEAGASWREEIDRALDDAAVSVLVVTPNFLASDFIFGEELPRILRRADEGRTRLVWIAAEHSSVEATPLARYQAANDPAHPLASLKKSDRQRVLLDIAKTIATNATLGTLASSLRIADETFEPLEALAEGREEVAGREFGVTARYRPADERISFEGGYQSITYVDLANLPPEDYEYVQDLEESLAANYDRWRKIRKEIGKAGGALDDEVTAELKRVVALMCADLTSILEFLQKIHKYDLEDHYGRYRHLCSQVT